MRCPETPRDAECCRARGRAASPGPAGAARRQPSPSPRPLRRASRSRTLVRPKYKPSTITYYGRTAYPAVQHTALSSACTAAGVPSSVCTAASVTSSAHTATGRAQSSAHTAAGGLSSACTAAGEASRRLRKLWSKLCVARRHCQRLVRFPRLLNWLLHRKPGVV
jgi:hypothetical protein